jgi:hypothetical protein
VAWLEQAKLSEKARWIVSRQLTRLQGLEAEIHEVEARLEQLTEHDPLVQR